MFQVAQIAYEGHQVIRYQIFADNVDEAALKIKAYTEQATSSTKNVKTFLVGNERDIRVEFDIVTGTHMPIHITRILTLVDIQ